MSSAKCCPFRLVLNVLWGITLDGNVMNNDVNPLRAGTLLNNAERLTSSLWLQMSCRNQNISIPHHWILIRVVMVQGLSLRRQDISNHDIDYVKYVDPCLTRGRVSTTCVMSMWRNDIKCKYMYASSEKFNTCHSVYFTSGTRVQWPVQFRNFKNVSQKVFHTYFWMYDHICVYDLWNISVICTFVCHLIMFDHSCSS